MRKFFGCLILVLICQDGLFGAATAGARSRNLLFDIPGGQLHVRKSEKFSWAEYCPDETCEVIRTRRPISRAEISGFALSYFFYVSDYSYLEAWKSNASVKEAADIFLNSHEQVRCSPKSGREYSICMLRDIADKHQIEILFVRHDERRVTVRRLERDAAIR